jgi:hypothetical protein
MNPPANDGGSQIISYQLQIRQRDTDEWITVLGNTGLNLRTVFTVPSFLAATGQLIQARFRCKNAIGWSEFSDLDYLLKAGVPYAPPAPIFIQADSSSVTLQV